MKRIRTFNFSFWTEVFMDRVGDVEVEVKATVDENGDDVQVKEILLNGQEISDQLGDKNHKIIDEKASDAAFDQLGELRAEGYDRDWDLA